MGNVKSFLKFLQKAFPDFGWAFFFLFAFQTVVLHRFGLSWNWSFLDAGLTVGLLLLVGCGLQFFLRFYKPGFNSDFYKSIFALELAAMVCGVLYFTPGFGIPLDGLENEFFINSIQIRFLLAFAVFYGLLSRLYLQERLLEQKEWESRALKTEQMQKEAELNQIRQQLQPHFLFNSLNSINALIGRQPEMARKMTQQLSDFLRGTIKREDSFITLQNELEHLSLYLEIEKVRFGQRLGVEIDAEKEILDIQIPAMILQPLVENAIKFGLYGSLGEVLVQIKARKELGYMSISISNPFEDKPNQASRGTGFGLNSVKRRLQLLFGRIDLLNISEKEGFFICTVKIPINYEKGNLD